MPIDSGNLALKGLDDLFSTEENRQEEQREQVQQIPIDALHPFTNHPFKVLDDEAMTRTVESIAQYGVLAPLIARPRPDGDGYEIISGHRRQYAAKLAGLDTLPVIVRQMSDDAAVILMVDSNLQREHILPSERALAYKMKLDAMRRTSGRPSKENVSQIGTQKRSDQIMAEELGESRNQIQRFIRLTNLIPELLDMVDEKKIAFNPAVELSYLDESQQRDFLEAMEDTQNAPSLSQAQQLKKMAQQGEFSYEKAFDVMGQEKKSEKDTVTIKNETLRKYFPRSYAQGLYEKRLITYPRTDSRFLTEDMAASLPGLVTDTGRAFAVEEPIPIHVQQVIDGSKVTDHHALLPTKSMAKADLAALPAGERNVLRLISARLLCAVGEPHRYAETTLTTICAEEEFSAKGKVVLSDGWKVMERKMLGELLGKQKEAVVLPDAQEQSQCSVADAELKEGQTSPPKSYTEDTLLSAMQAAGADSMPEGVERQGIGTPATRAATIEKLVQKGFLERKGTKKTKVLLPTDKGKALITVMPEEIQSPEMTADWETKLLQIERGEMEPGEFMTEINTMITELVKNTEMKKGVNRPDVRDIERQHKNRVCDSEKRERPAFEGRTLLPHPQGTSFDLSHRIRTRSHHPGVTSLHSLLPLGTLMVSAAEVTYSSGCKDRR